MTHAEVRTKLPWYVSGSLEGDELAAIEVHLRDCEACRAELARTVAAGRLFAAAHPAPSELVDFAWEAVADAASREALGRHLDACAACREEVDLARASRALERATRPAPAPSAAATLAAWRGWMALAAGIAIVALAGVAWVAAQRSAERARFEASLREVRDAARVARAAADDAAARLARERAPRGDVTVVELLPESVARGAAGAPPVRLERARGGLALLVLPVERSAPGASYVARLLDAAGAERLVVASLVADGRGAVRILLATDLLPPGRTSIELRPEGAREARPSRYTLILD